MKVVGGPVMIRVPVLALRALGGGLRQTSNVNPRGMVLPEPL